MSKPDVDLARTKLGTLSDGDLATLSRWFKEGFVLLPPGWTDPDAFATLVREELKRRPQKQ
jgi:hypothetical protein